MTIMVNSKRILGIVFLTLGILIMVVVVGVRWSDIFGMTAWWSIQYYFIIPASIGVILSISGLILLYVSK